MTLKIRSRVEERIYRRSAGYRTQDSATLPDRSDAIQTSYKQDIMLTILRVLVLNKDLAIDIEKFPHIQLAISQSALSQSDLPNLIS